MFSTQTWKMGSCIHSSILFIFYILSNLLSCMVQINFNTFFISYKFATRLWKESFIYSFFIFYQIRWAVWFNLILIHFFISYKFATRLWKEAVWTLWFNLIIIHFLDNLSIRYVLRYNFECMVKFYISRGILFWRLL